MGTSAVDTVTVMYKGRCRGQIQRADAEGKCKGKLQRSHAKGSYRRADAEASYKSICRGKRSNTYQADAQAGRQAVASLKEVGNVPSLPSCMSLLMATLAFSMVQTATDSPLQLTIHTVTTFTGCKYAPAVFLTRSRKLGFTKP